MTLSEWIERERRIQAGFRRQFVFTVSAVLLFSAAALLLLGYERIYMGNILRWIIDALAPLGEAIAAACTQGDAAALYLSVMESEAALLVMQMVVYVLTLGIPFFCCRRAVLRRTARREPLITAYRQFARTSVLGAVRALHRLEREPVGQLASVYFDRCRQYRYIIRQRQPCADLLRPRADLVQRLVVELLMLHTPHPTSVFL